MHDKIGVLVCGEIGNNVAALVFVDGTEPLYILPSHLFYATVEERRILSKSQLSKRERVPSIGENIEFDVEGRVIKDFIKSQPYRTTTTRDGCLQIFAECVISDEYPLRRCWARIFGIIPIDVNWADFAIPNVAYSSRIDFHLEIPKIRRRERVQLDSFFPGYRFKFSSFEKVLLDKESYIREAPWNRHIPLLIYPDNDLEPYQVPVKEDYIVGYYSGITCLALEDQDLYCSQFPKDRCRVAFFKERTISYKSGAQLKVDMYRCKYNNYFIVTGYIRITSVDPFPYDHLDDGTLILLVSLNLDERTGFLYNHFTSYVVDPLNLLSLLIENGEKQFNCWIKYLENFEERDDLIIRFTIVRLGFTEKEKLKNFVQ